MCCAVTGGAGSGEEGCSGGAADERGGTAAGGGGGALAVGARVKVPWGTGRELYEAEIAGVHGGGAYKLHYLTIGGDWDQWVTRTKIIRKLKERA